MRTIALILSTTITAFALDAHAKAPLALIEGNPPQARMRLEITTDADLQKLKAHFPDYAKSPTGAEAVALDPKYIITLPATEGRTIKVKTDGRIWFITSGYWKVNGELEKFITALGSGKGAP